MACPVWFDALVPAARPRSEVQRLRLRPGDRLRVHEIGASTGGWAEPVEVCFGDRETGPFTYWGQGSSVFELSFESRPPSPPEDARCRARLAV